MSDEQEYATGDALTVKRDEEGELLPVDAETQFGTIKVLPMAYGTIERMFGDAGDVAEADAEIIAEVLSEYLLKPDLRKQSERGVIDAQFVREDVLPMVPREVITAILEESGVEADVMVDQQGNAQVALDEGNRR